jgi:hypothetical protein
MLLHPRYSKASKRQVAVKVSPAESYAPTLLVIGKASQSAGYEYTLKCTHSDRLQKWIPYWPFQKVLLRPQRMWKTHPNARVTTISRATRALGIFRTLSRSTYHSQISAFIWEFS